jgi:hypothetical protein
MGQLVHKSRTGVALCGRYGYLSFLWKRVNCDACLRRRR